MEVVLNSLLVFQHSVWKSKTWDLLHGIVSDSNNIFLWHKSKDINTHKKEGLLLKFQLIQILHLHVTHDYVHWHYYIDYCFDKTLCKKKKKDSHFIKKWFCLIPFGKCAFLRRATNRCTNSNFEIFDRAFYMKSGSMSLIKRLKSNSKTLNMYLLIIYEGFLFLFLE